MKTETVAEVHEAENALSTFDQLNAERRKALVAATQAAQALQAELDALLAERAGVVQFIAKAKFEINLSTERVNLLNEHFKNHFQFGGMADLILEVGRHEFLLQRMPTYLAEAEKKLAALDKSIPAFRKAHGL